MKKSEGESRVFTLAVLSLMIGNRRKLLLGLFLSLFLIGIVSAIPQTLNVQGKLTNSSNGLPLTGTYNINFTIYDAATNGNVLWTDNYSVTTDSNGIYSVILTGINLNFSEQYYLGIRVAGDSEMTPRINLTSSPYSFRASNISITGVEFDSNVNLTDKNITTTGRGFFGFLGSLASRITGLFVGDINANGTFNLTGDLVVNNSVFFVNATSGYIGIGTSTPLATLNVIGDINATGNITAAYFIGDGSQLTGISGDNSSWNESYANTLNILSKK